MYGLITLSQPLTANPPAASANQMVMTNIIRLRSTMSARAPAGKVKKKNGNEATVDIRERNKGESLARFMAHVAAVSCAATQVPEIKLASHMFRKTGFRRAVQVEVLVIERLVYLVNSEGRPNAAQTNGSFSSQHCAKPFVSIERRRKADQ